MNILSLKKCCFNSIKNFFFKIVTHFKYNLTIDYTHMELECMN